MERRHFGRTDLEVSRLAFGCGAVGGLMVKGRAGRSGPRRRVGPRQRDKLLRYGRELRQRRFGDEFGTSARREYRRHRRILQGGHRRQRDGRYRGCNSLRNRREPLPAETGSCRPLSAAQHLRRGDKVAPGRGIVDADIVLSEIVPAFEKLRDAGKIRHLGFTAKGDADDLHALVASGAFDSAQIFYNLLVPSAGEHIPDNYPCDDFRELLSAADRNGVGSIGVRVLAGGAFLDAKNAIPWDPRTWHRSAPTLTTRQTCNTHLPFSRLSQTALPERCRNSRCATPSRIQRSRPLRLASRTRTATTRRRSRRKRPAPTRGPVADPGHPKRFRFGRLDGTQRKPSSAREDIEA